MRTVVLLVVALAVAHTGGLSLGADGESKLSVPDQAAQEQSLALVRDIYKEDLAAAKQPKDKALLAKKFLQEGIKTAGDAAGKYVLLTQARRLAVEANEAATAMEAIDALAGGFAIDELKMKAAALDTLTQGTTTPARAKKIAEIVQALIDEAARRDDFDCAEELLRVAVVASQKANHTGLVKEITARAQNVAQLRKAYGATKAALAKLEKEPADPEANLVAGQYACFVKGDWQSGLSMLALGGDERLKTLAATELAGPQDEQKQLELADAWWNLAETYEGKQQTQVRLHAAQWYEGTLPRLAGLSKAKATKRVEQMEKEAVKESVARQGDSKASTKNESSKSKHTRKSALEITNSIGVQLRLIPAGTFTMGSPSTQRRRRSNETPHKVTLTRDYYIGVHEVTQEQYVRVMGENPSEFKGPQIPVENVSWEHAVVFCQRLSASRPERSAGREYRLPTEAEWEYACRAGTETAYSFGDDESQLTDYGWFDKNSGPAIHPIAQKEPNPWGLYDVHGNVWEWCNDWHGVYPNGELTDPPGPTNGSSRVYRGSAWDSYDWTCRSANRDGNVPRFHNHSLGFRVVCDVVKGPQKK